LNKVGVANRDPRVRNHRGRGYRLIAQWTGLEHGQGLAVERAVIARWRAAGFKPVTSAPRNGRTEIAPTAQLAATRAHLGLLLGAAAVPRPRRASDGAVRGCQRAASRPGRTPISSRTRRLTT